MTPAEGLAVLSGFLMEALGGLLGIAYLMPGILAGAVCFIVIIIMVIRELRK